uniref:Fe2OG dioxygenase domain-containing protein n=1 Tax=Parascaris univalens TaxID=6257 RepID=A0A915AXC3_PARUN
MLETSEIPLECACKGIRFCALCKNSERVLKLKLNDREKYLNYERYVYSSRHGRAIYDPGLPADPSIDDVHTAAARVDSLIKLDPDKCLTVGGILLIDDFLSDQEEKTIMRKIDSKEWIISQSGRRKQQKKVKMDSFLGMPEYTDFILQRMEALSSDRLNAFQPFELCNLEYVESRQSAIELHFDDCWIWGNRLISLNLLNDSVVTFTNDERELVVYAALPRRTLLCMCDEVRYEWKHGVLPQHVRGRRIALTMREPSPAFQEGGELYEKFGRELIRLSNIRVIC